MDSKDNKIKLLRRISYIVGHLQGVYKMIDEDRYCIDVIKQMQAVKASIDRVDEIILSGHLDSCVSSAIESRDKAARKKVLKEVLSVFKTNE